MAKMYTLDSKLLCGCPEIRIGEKIFPVDDRKNTVEKILDLCKEAEESKDSGSKKIDDIFRLAFSPKDFKEISGMDISWSAYQELFTLVIAAVTGKEPSEINSGGDKFQE